MILKNIIISVWCVFLILSTTFHSSNTKSLSVGLLDNPNDDCVNTTRLYLPQIVFNEMDYFKGPLELEPNNSYLQANGPIISGEAYYGLLNDQKDYYSVYLKDRGSISIVLDNIFSKGVQLQLFYQDPKNGPIEPIKTDIPYTMQHTGPSGWYYIYIAIDSRYVNTSSVHYFLKVDYNYSSLQSNNSIHLTNNTCITPTPTATLTPLTPITTITPLTPTITPTPIPPIQVGFDFETDTKNWITTEGQYKLAILDTTSQLKYTGNQALRVTTQLKTSPDVYRHTEAVAYFDKAIPEGMSKPGPYNFAGKQIYCFVYLPQELIASGYPKARVLLLVKDVAPHFRNQWSDPIDITPSNVDKWFKLSLTVGQGNMDAGFDPTAVNTLGVRIETWQESGLNYTGPFYIDRCTVE